MNKKAKSIVMMIEKECCRNSLSELCEYWGVTTDDFEAFLNAGMKHFEEESNDE